jgi:hypothetical protein
MDMWGLCANHVLPENVNSYKFDFSKHVNSFKFELCSPIQTQIPIVNFSHFVFLCPIHTSQVCVFSGNAFLEFL